MYIYIYICKGQGEDFLFSVTHSRPQLKTCEQRLNFQEEIYSQLLQEMLH